MFEVPGHTGRRVLLLCVVTAVMAVLGPLAAVAAGDGSPPTGGGGLGGPGTTTTTVGTVTTTPASSGSTTAYNIAPPPVLAAPKGTAFASRGMWIWELAATDGGSVPAIVAQARSYGVQTLYIKSGDGVTFWPQFSRALVSELHGAGLRVCAWQFVYGIHPVGEANVGLQSVSDGANCLVIDAESAYQGRYAQAQSYMGALRARLGSGYPIGLAGFPYIDYHPSFPYSVFLGRNGAQFNAPQMYWQDIGTTPAAVFAHTYEFNELYQRPIFPLGQIYNSPPASAVTAFRSISRYYGAGGLSWWDWQAAGSRQWSAIAQPAGPIAAFAAQRTVASLGPGAVGDVVVWAQEHLVAAGEQVSIDGGYGPLTRTAVENFQAAHALTPTGVIDPLTWNALLSYRPAAVRWTLKKGKTTAVTARAHAVNVVPVPSALLRAGSRNELHGEPGQGRP